MTGEGENKHAYNNKSPDIARGSIVYFLVNHYLQVIKL